MDRNEAKEFYPILHAFAEGKVIECRLKPDFIKGSGFSNDWTGVKDLWYMKGLEYRIKPEQEPKYRPFANAEECWKEMLKHQPFGYTYDRLNNIRDSITKVATTGVSYDSPTVISFAEIFGRFVFADGVPFGMKVE
ncbi:hypothetical protein [Prevotella sp.]|uniref:hypothetical protein n=1 Tax=Prevotella sp. TaxID=59823 RepID=UPI0025D4E0D5|nr:hypothetical protein [Prevotella sp.]